MNLWQKIKARLPRLSGWMLIALALTLAVGFFNMSLLGVSLYKLSLAVTAGIVGYFLDRGIFPYARPDDYLTDTSFNTSLPPIIVDEFSFIAAMIRRAIIIAACIIGVCLGA